MKKVYLITGAAGHVGSALCMRLRERGEAMRALCMRGEDTTLVRQLGAEVFFGDVTQPETMRPFFTLPEGTQLSKRYTVSYSPASANPSNPE